MAKRRSSLRWSILIKRLWENLQTCLRPGWQRPEVAALYGAAAVQARRAEFYRDAAVPDTLDGRFELLILHLALIMLRLRTVRGRDSARMRQHLFDFLGADMDRNLREMGIGDMGISRRVKAMGQAFYGRLASYDSALTQPESARRGALMTALDKNLYGTVPTVPEALCRMADYIAQSHAMLDLCPYEKLLRGAFVFENPSQTSIH